MLKLLLIACLAVGGFNLIAAMTFYGTDLTIREEKEAEKMSSSFIKLNATLHKELPKNENTEANIGLAKRLLTKVKPTCLGGPTAEQKSLEAFVALEQTSGKCDLESYKILAKVYQALHSVDPSQNNNRVWKILNNYRVRHGIDCRLKYRAIYDELVETVPLDVRENLTSIFSYLFPHHFYRTLSLKWNTLASIPRPIFSDESLDKIVNGIAIVLQKSPDWEKVKANGVDLHGRKTYPKLPKELLDEYLFEPCEVYHTKLDGVLSPARFDAKLADDSLVSDRRLMDAMGYNRLCAVLLEERKELYKPLRKNWSEITHHFISYGWDNM